MDGSGEAGQGRPLIPAPRAPGEAGRSRGVLRQPAAAAGGVEQTHVELALRELIILHPHPALVCGAGRAWRVGDDARAARGAAPHYHSAGGSGGSSASCDGGAGGYRGRRSSRTAGAHRDEGPEDADAHEPGQGPAGTRRARGGAGLISAAQRALSSRRRGPRRRAEGQPQRVSGCRARSTDSSCSSPSSSPSGAGCPAGGGGSGRAGSAAGHACRWGKRESRLGKGAHRLEVAVLLRVARPAEGLVRLCAGSALELARRAISWARSWAGRRPRRCSLVRVGARRHRSRGGLAGVCPGGGGRGCRARISERFPARLEAAGAHFLLL